jgi:Rhs element Vgr protein
VRRALPEFVLKLGGAEAAPTLRDDVLRIEVHEEVGRLARAEVLLSNWREGEAAVKHSDTAALGPGVAVEIQLGTDAATEPVFHGVITGLLGHFAPGRQPTLTVDCRCRGALLAAARRSRVFEDATDADAASAIAADYGLTPDVGSGGPAHPVLVQHDTTDWDFLRARAEALGWVLYLRGETLAFRPPAASEEPVAELEWGETLLELEMGQHLGPRCAQVTAASWDPETLEVVETTVGADDGAFAPGGRPSVGDALDAAAWPLRDTRLAHAGVLAGDELEAWARAEVNRGALRHIAGRGRAAGNPSIRIDRSLRLQKLGERYSGAHYVTAVRHVLAPGVFHTEFQLGQPPSVRAAASPLNALGAALVPATVEDIDDPNGWGRVRVRLPWLHPDIPGVWARLALPAAGDSRGFYFIPEVGDEVVVGFVGDTRFPVVVGSLWNGSHAPPVSLDAATNAVRALVSRAGHRLTFDDSDGAALVKVETAAGQAVLLDDSSGSEAVVLSDKTGNKLTLDSTGIVLTAASGKDVSIQASGGKVKIEASQIEGTSTGPAKIQSSAALDLQASATLGITGALVKINS